MQDVLATLLSTTTSSDSDATQFLLADLLQMQLQQ